MRKCICSLIGRFSFSLAISSCTAIAHSTASTALAKSATTLSPAVLKMRPWCERDQSVDDGAAPLQPGERADFVARHQPAVAGNVGGENRGEFAFDRLDGHAWLLSTKYSKPHNRRVSFQAQIVAAQSHET